MHSLPTFGQVAVLPALELSRISWILGRVCIEKRLPRPLFCGANSLCTRHSYTKLQVVCIYCNIMCNFDNNTIPLTTYLLLAVERCDVGRHRKLLIRIHAELGLELW